MKRTVSRNYKRLQALRILTQTVLFLLYIQMLLNTRYPGEDYIGRVEIFFHFDPLIALASMTAGRTFLISFGWAALTILVTLLVGRVACGWICPMGSMQQFFSAAFKKAKFLKPKKTVRRETVWKYYILLLILAGTACSLNLVGLMDPFSLLTRSMAAGFLPALDHVFSGFTALLYRVSLSSLGDPLNQLHDNLDINAVFFQGFFLSLIFVGILLLNMKRERFWCRILCPLGALLGLMSRWNLLKLHIDAERCTGCTLCTIRCQTQADPFPQQDWKSAECIYCMTCGAVCPKEALSFRLGTDPEPLERINLSRRKVILSTGLGLVAAPFFRIGPARSRAAAALVRPPGSLSEVQFLRKCIKCGECMKVCPTNALQPARTEAGPEGIWTPLLVSKIGYCEYYCSLCSQVCPTGAIRELTVEEKTTVKIGTAWVEKNRCIPWKLGEHCIVCEEHCPLSPKAIKMVRVQVLQPDGSIKTPLAPVIDTQRCTGCGVCRNKCPLVDKPGISVSSIGESRSERNQFHLDLIRPMEDLGLDWDR